MDIAINYLAVIAAAVSNMVVGFLWYGPVFGRIWIKEMHFTEESMKSAREKGMTMLYVLQAVGALVTAFVLAHFIVLFGATDMSMALQLGVWAWLGFVATTLLSFVLWEGKSWKLYALQAGYYLVAIEIMALILVSWPA